MKSISWQDFEKFLFYVGCTYKRQKGDHKIYWRSDLKRPIVLPMYKNIPIFIIKNKISKFQKVIISLQHEILKQV